MAPRVWFTLGILVIIAGDQFLRNTHISPSFASLPSFGPVCHINCLHHFLVKKTLSRSGTNKDGYTSRTVFFDTVLHTTSVTWTAPFLLDCSFIALVSAKMTQSVIHSRNSHNRSGRQKTSNTQLSHKVSRGSGRALHYSKKGARRHGRLDLVLCGKGARCWVIRNTVHMISAQQHQPRTTRPIFEYIHAS
jgi:hypothetical protein